MFDRFHDFTPALGGLALLLAVTAVLIRYQTQRINDRITPISADCPCCPGG
jgi:OFA family oxalate/formate antiporter-like MFS transporter